MVAKQSFIRLYPVVSFYNFQKAHNYVKINYLVYTN